SLRDTGWVAHHDWIEPAHPGREFPHDEKSERPDDAQHHLFGPRVHGARRLLDLELDIGLGHRSRLQGASQFSSQRNSVTSSSPNDDTTITSTKISAARSLVE